MTRQQILNRINRKISEHESLRQAANALGISPSYLSEIRLGTRQPGPKILEQLGCKRVVMPRKVRYSAKEPV